MPRHRYETPYQRRRDECGRRAEVLRLAIASARMLVQAREWGAEPSAADALWDRCEDLVHGTREGRRTDLLRLNASDLHTAAQELWRAAHPTLQRLPQVSS